MSFGNLKKRGMIATDKLLIVILAVIVIVIVAMIMFRFDIGGFVKLLPGYSLPENDIAIEFVDDDVIGDICSDGFVGQIYAPEGGVLKMGGRQYIYMDKVRTNFYWDGNEDDGQIKVWKKNGIDKVVGEIVNGIVYLDDEEFFIDLGEEGKFFNYDSDKYNAIENYVTVFDLLSLHNSKYSGNNLICVGEKEEIITNWRIEDGISVLVRCGSDEVCVNAEYNYCVREFCESGQIGSLCENDADCDMGTCVKRQQCYPGEDCLSEEEMGNFDLGFCGYTTNSNCEEFNGDGNSGCYCGGCDCGNQIKEMNDGTIWICNDIFEHIMPQIGFLAPAYYSDECESGDLVGDTFNMIYGGKSFSPSRCNLR
jgi:hypothetical protein